MKTLRPAPPQKVTVTPALRGRMGGTEIRVLTDWTLLLPSGALKVCEQGRSLKSQLQGRWPPSVTGQRLELAREGHRLLHLEGALCPRDLPGYFNTVNFLLPLAEI